MIMNINIYLDMIWVVVVQALIGKLRERIWRDSLYRRWAAVQLKRNERIINLGSLYRLRVNMLFQQALFLIDNDI